MLPYNKEMKPRAQKLRKYATPQEKKLWFRFLRRHKCPFTRQKTIDQYIVDFLCPSKNLVIEVDGSQHYTINGMENDSVRTVLLESLGLHVLRFTNDEIDNSFEKVCKRIQEELNW